MAQGNDATGADASNVASETSALQHELSRDEQPSTAVVEAVATATDRDPTDLSPLHHLVDADALDALVRPGGPRDGIRVSFAYDGVEVAVDSEDGIEVRNPPAEDG